MRRLGSLVLVVHSLPCFAWGPEGHHLIARMAQDMLATDAAARVQATLAPGESIASLASWADEVRKTRKETEPWHFIDIPIDSSGLNMQRDCPAAGCVLGKIVEFSRQWQDPHLSPAARREALLFLVHFVGDMHEPLHCANDNDRGGNDVTVKFGGASMNLHHLWDSALLDRMLPENELFDSLSHMITPEEKIEWARGSVQDWASESFDLARKVVYGDLPQTHSVDENYEHIADPVIQRQLQKAAVRLASFLNQAP